MNDSNIYDKNGRAYHNLVIIGQLGEATKIITFKENEFKSELAPTNAQLVHNVINHERFVTMTYKV